jgi:hypothetical protein
VLFDGGFVGCMCAKALTWQHHGWRPLTPTRNPQRASNPHLRKAFALLGAVVPEPRDIRGNLLDKAARSVKQSTLEYLMGKRFAIITNGWSKRTAARATPLINVMVCPDDGPAVAWRVEDASRKIKDTAHCTRCTTAS